MLSDQNAEKPKLMEEAISTKELIECLAKEELAREIALRQEDQESLTLVALLQ